MAPVVASPRGTPSSGQALRVLSPLAGGPETPGTGEARGKAPVALAESRLSPLLGAQSRAWGGKANRPGTLPFGPFAICPALFKLQPCAGGLV